MAILAEIRTLQGISVDALTLANNSWLNAAALPYALAAGGRWEKDMGQPAGLFVNIWG